jgi:hypothetical protein
LRNGGSYENLVPGNHEDADERKQEADQPSGEITLIKEIPG